MGRAIQWLNETRVDDVVTFRVGRKGRDFIADWPGRARLTCAPDGTSVRIRRAPGAAAAALDKLRGPMRGLLGDLRGELALHASAVSANDAGVVFLGPSGAGKSTAAAEMCAFHGAQFLSDEVALLRFAPRTISVLPCEDHHHLTRSSRRSLGLSPVAGGKVSIQPRVVGNTAAVLRLVVALRFVRGVVGPSWRRLDGSQAAQVLLQAGVRFDPQDVRARRRELERASEIHHRVPVIEIVRPRHGQGARRIGPLIFEALAHA